MALEQSDPNPKKEEHEAQPHTEGTPQNFHKGDGSTTFRMPDEISVKSIPDLVAAYKRAQEDSTAYNKKALLINSLTLIAVVAYTTVAAIQGCASNRQATAAEEANRLLEESTRARLSIEVKLDPVVVGKAASMTITIENTGHMITSYTYAYGHMIGKQLPLGALPLVDDGTPNWIDAGKTSFAGATDAEHMTQDLMDNLPRLSDPSILLGGVPTTPTVYLFGMINYESFGKKHRIEYCDYIVRNDASSVIPLGSGLRDSEFVLKNCPKWNSSE